MGGTGPLTGGELRSVVRDGQRFTFCTDGEHGLIRSFGSGTAQVWRAGRWIPVSQLDMDGIIGMGEDAHSEGKIIGEISVVEAVARAAALGIDPHSADDPE